MKRGRPPLPSPARLISVRESSDRNLLSFDIQSEALPSGVEPATFLSAREPWGRWVRRGSPVIASSIVIVTTQIAKLTEGKTSSSKYQVHKSFRVVAADEAEKKRWLVRGRGVGDARGVHSQRRRWKKKRRNRALTRKTGNE